MALYRRSTLSLLFTLVVACDPEFTSKPCPAGQVPDNAAGVCRPCEAGTAPDLKTGQCKACEAGFAPDASRQCAPSTQNPAGSGGSGGAGGMSGQAGMVPGGSGGSSGSGEGIGGSGGAPIDSGTAHLRIVHLSPDAGPLNVCARRHSTDAAAPFDLTLQSSISYKAMTAYLDVPAGPLDLRLVQVGDSCGGTPVTPDNVGLEPLEVGQFAMLSLAGLRTPSAVGGVPAEQVLGARLFSDPAPTEGQGDLVPWVRFIVFSIKTPPLDAGEYENYMDEEYFSKAWSSASYGVAATPEALPQAHGYRSFDLNYSTGTVIGVSVAPETSTTRPDALLPFFNDLADENSSVGDKYDLFVIGQYAGLSALSALFCRKPGVETTAAVCEDAAFF